MYFVYILASRKADWHYIGSISNLVNRVAKHNKGGVKSTKPYRPLGLAYSEKFETRIVARKRESFLKKTAAARRELFSKIDGLVV